MAPKTRKISTLIEQQLPGFISSEYENFSKLVEKYYEQLEVSGQPIDIISNITKYRDIDFYEENLLKQNTVLAANIDSDATTINVEDATSFPKENGYIRIGQEICFYKFRTNTQFLDVSRGVSGNTTLGDLYSETNFVSTESAAHKSGDLVYNVSNLFLYAFIKNFEAQYLGAFPEKYLKGQIDKRTLIKNINKFYKSKGTDRSIKFIFNSIISRDPSDVPEVYNPKDSTIKASTSDWVSTYSLKVKVISGDPSTLVGEPLIQNLDETKPQMLYASAVVDNVVFKGSTEEGDIYEIILDPATINGTFEVASKTKLKKVVSSNLTTGDKINVGSTLGWRSSGKILIGNEIIKYSSKNVSQFVVEQRGNPPSAHSVGNDVYSFSTVSGKNVTLLTLGILYNLNVASPAPYSEEKDAIQVSKSGFETRDPIIFNKTNNSVRWIFNTNNQAPSISSNVQLQSALSQELANVSAVYEDDQYYYICSSGYPSHNILTSGINLNLVGQNILRLIRKAPTTTTEVYSTGVRDVGIFIDGTLALNHRDSQFINFGKLKKISVTNQGKGYKNPPYVLLNNQPKKATAVLSGEVLESIIIDTQDSFNSIPTVTITAGRGAKVEAVVTSGKVTSLIIRNPGEYYSSPPIIRITDLSGRGKFADYRSVISPKGQLVDFVKVDEGKFYTKENIVVEVIEDGRNTEAQATAETEKWYFDRLKKNITTVDDSYGYVFETYESINNQDKQYLYGRIGNPIQLRVAVNDNLNSTFDEPATKVHSPILGFAYDGVPIYGPFGYQNPVDSTSSIARLSSGYRLKTFRLNGPSTSRYPLGTFVEDYEWRPSVNSGKTELDENNGRFCVTPDYPNGVYAYFLTIDSNNIPTFPYILGKNYYSLPVDSNYNSNISQNDLPVSATRLRTPDLESNGSGVYAYIESTTTGGVSAATIEDSNNNFKVGSFVRINNSNTGGTESAASVASIVGKDVLSLESKDIKSTQIITSQTSYYFKNDVISQPSTGAIGELIGDVINDNQLVLRNVIGTFVPNEEIESSINVINLVLDKNSSFTVNSVVSLFDGISAPIATGLVLETTNNQNSLKLKVLTGEFIVDDEFFLKSSNLNDTVGSKIITITSLSIDIIPFNINENIAIAETEENHNLTVGDKIVIDVNPDDSLTETEYYVRKRYYQKVTLRAPRTTKKINDLGLGRYDLLNSGIDYAVGTYNDVELVFQNNTTARNNIGLPGNSGNARANIIVSGVSGSNYGGVVQVIITDKGNGYRKGDILTVADEDLNRLISSVSTQRLTLLVDHVGFARANTTLKLNSITNISDGDNLQIGDEIVEVTSVNETEKTVSVIRGRKQTRIVDHYNNKEVVVVNAKYRFTEGQRIKGTELNDPFVSSYDENTQELTLVFDYSASSPNQLLRSNTFYDASSPQKLVSISSVDNSEYRLEFSKDNQVFKANPVVQIQKYYKYKFDVSHFSMLDTYLDFSTSLNYNVFAEEKVVSSIPPGNPGSFLSIKLGFGPNIATNTFEQKKPINFTNYFYFIKVSDVNTQNSFLQVVDDPLGGEKTVIYSTDNKFVYELNSVPEYDGTGQINYTTSSRFAVGKINSILIENFGKDYRRVPTIYGVDVAQEYEAAVNVIYDPIEQKIKSVAIIDGGRNYSKPKAIVVDGDGVDAEFDVVVENGVIRKVAIIKEGRNYSYIPTVKIIESDVKLYFTSTDIGIPQTINIIENGYAFHADKTLYSKFESPTVLLLENFNDNAFAIGEKIVQYDNGVIISSGIVAKNGFRPGSNILRLEKITGVIDKSLPIKGTVKNNTASIKTILSTVFSPDIKGFFDNQGRFSSDRGKLSVSSQKITDSFFYQDYSYVIKSKTPISVWKDLIKETVHPAGFKLFGEVAIESDGNTTMPSNTENKTQSITFIDLKTKNISLIGTRKQVTQSFVNLNSFKVERGLGSISVDTFDNSETIAGEFILSTAFTGRLDSYDGQAVGNVVFTMIDKKSGLPITPYNEQQLIITIDGVLQEPGKDYTVNQTEITFVYPPFGDSIVEGQPVSGQKFYGKYFKFKNDDLNSRYLRKLKSIETDFTGVDTTFDLYYENGDIVKTDKNENLIITLNAVVQKAKVLVQEETNQFYSPSKNSYYILRSEDPAVTDKIVFSDPPIRHNEIGETEPELSGYEKSFGFTIGSYIRLKINADLIPFRRSGPFLITDEVTDKVKKIDDSKYALVFIDGVLQIEGESYNISGPTITFNKPLNYFEAENGEVTYQNVSIILLYGRDISQSLTAYDFERDTFYNKLSLEISGANTYITFAEWYGVNSSREIWVYQENNNVLGKLRSFMKLSPTDWQIVLSSQNVKYNTSYPLKFSVYPQLNHPSDLILTGTYQVSTSYNENSDGERILTRTSSRNLYGSELADQVWLALSRSYANLHPGDLIKIDGENSYREVSIVPAEVKTKDYRQQSFVSNDIYSKVRASNYNDIVKGEGLSVIAKVSNGKVISLEWNRRELELYFENNLLLQPTAYQYYTPPVLQFIPNDFTGGGAKAEVIVSDGQIVDIILMDGGSNYQEDPTVVVTRKYDIIRYPNRKINSSTNIYLNLEVSQFAMQSSSIINLEGAGRFAGIETVITFGNINPDILFTKNIFRIISPPSRSARLKDQIIPTKSYITIGNREPIQTSLVSIDNKITYIITAPLDIVSKSTITKVDAEIYRQVIIKVNNAILETPQNSTNDIGAFLDLPLTTTDSIVYIADTRRFPDSSRLLIGKEVVVYNGKLPDRFLNVIRGALGTTATTHEAGDYLRHLPELVSIVPVGPTTSFTTEVKITEVHKTDILFVRIFTASIDKVANASLPETPSIEIRRENEFNVDTSDIDVIQEIVFKPPTSYATSLSSYTATFLGRLFTPSIDDVTNVSLPEVPSVEIVRQNDYNVNTSDIQVIQQITISPPETYLTSLNSYAPTFIYRGITPAFADVPDARLSETPNVEILRQNQIGVDTSDVDVIQQITIIPPETYLTSLNSYTSTFIANIITPAANDVSNVSIPNNPTASINYQFQVEINNSGIDLFKQITLSPPTIYVPTFALVSSTFATTLVGSTTSSIFSSTIANRLAKDADIEQFIKGGAVDYFEETVVLTDVIPTRLQGDIILDDPYNEIYQRNTNIIFAENQNVVIEQSYISYTPINAGFTLKSFENNAFIDTGAFDINGTIESVSLTFPALAIEDFAERPDSSITLANVVFNLAIPTINSVGTFISANVNTTQTTIEVQTTTGFPSSGKLLINKEIISYGGKTQTTFTNIVRGIGNTIPSSHSAGDYLRTFD
jgi:hypothetical protein